MIEPGDAFVHLNDKTAQPSSICLSIRTQKDIEGDEYYIITCFSVLTRSVKVFKISAYDLMRLIKVM